MSNFLENGTVLPHGLLETNDSDSIAGFNRTYRNTSLRMGIVVKCYTISDSKNISKLTNEYDVLVFEQIENSGISIVTYKNCISSEGMGSIADYFYKSLRVRKKSNKKVINTKNQDGALVLIHCLDGMTEKAIIISSLAHPDRASKLKTSEPYMEGEYNGVNIKVNEDGSTSLTFKGATNNDGTAKDASQGNTEIKIEKDGSYQVDHKTITFRLDKSGTASLTAKENVNVTAQGNITFQVTGNTTINSNGKCDVKSSGKTTVTASEINLNGASGKVLTNVTDPVVDLITGIPTSGVTTVKAG